MPASETLSRVTPLLAQFGITRVARHTGLDHIGMPVWCAYAPNAPSAVVAQGKGVSDDDAKVSAIMEALERAVASRPAASTLRATARDLQDEGHRLTTVACLTGLHKADIGLDEPVDWVIGRELISDVPIYVPFEAVVLNRTRESRFWMSSDGLASGNSHDEAILHGMLERIERDAYVLWQIGDDCSRRSRCVAPALFGDDVLFRLVEKIAAAGLVLKLFDITSDVGIPCFTALLGPRGILSDSSVRFLEVTGGSGAHPSPVRAAIRAITEAAQSRLTFISGARDDIAPEAFRALLPAQLRDSFLSEPVAPAPFSHPAGQSLQQYLSHTLDRLRAASINTVATVKLSAPDLPFVVVKVLIPELENPDGKRARRFGSRALSKAFQF
ncbi:MULTISPECIES: YcaO-like family protein [unclassified Rhizobium]|uniref:YcaO-like family protein n=1 Tax=unclassified Rhizobium TaxID=2613769 RepID=UPI001ADB1EDA|nr:MULTISPECIES: YcaO-like family protein [unclassified Rhizobium]MBO9127095.1 YcaO-like family protein [Rhizobium sp. 16-488-2b]MBO9177542.1 YcaO-like family protein [Rhizobium sp. 16-488-2a]